MQRHMIVKLQNEKGREDSLTEDHCRNIVLDATILKQNFKRKCHKANKISTHFI